MGFTVFRKGLQTARGGGNIAFGPFGARPRRAARMRPLTVISVMAAMAGIAALGLPQPGLAGQTLAALEEPDPDTFHRYWYSQGAEISRYRLQQFRYGEVHEGDAVLVYVTEAMNPELQVKAEHPEPQDIPVLKLNHVRKFFTGIYPYSILTSVFERADPGNASLTLKVSTSVQEWCGHIYTQLNLESDAYRVLSHSYFEEEADRDFRLAAVPVEDGLWTKIRIAPNELPRGRIRMIVSSLFARLVHRPLAERRAVATLAASAGRSLEGNPLVVYTLTYPDEKRSVKIFFEKSFPHRIQRWEEQYPGLNGKPATTRAERTHTTLIDYWNHHENRDRALLKRLGLSAAEMDARSESD